MKLHLPMRSMVQLRWSGRRRAKASLRRKKWDFMDDSGVHKIPNIELAPRYGVVKSCLACGGMGFAEALTGARYMKNCSNTIFPFLTS